MLSTVGTQSLDTSWSGGACSDLKDCLAAGMTGTEGLWGPSRVLNQKAIMKQVGNAGGYDPGGDGGEVWRGCGRNTGSGLGTLIRALMSKQVD